MPTQRVTINDFLPLFATNTFHAATRWSPYSPPSRPDNDGTKNVQAIVDAANEASQFDIFSFAVGNPMERLPAAHSRFLFDTFQATAGQMRGSLEGDELTDLRTDQRTDAIAIGNSVLAARSRFSDVPWITTAKHELAKEFIKSTWEAHYGGNEMQEWKNLDWDKVATIALEVVEHFEDQDFFLCNNYWFDNATKYFDERMRAENGWAGLPDFDQYQGEGLKYWHCAVNSNVTLHAAYAVHELYREPESLTFQELGIKKSVA